MRISGHGVRMLVLAAVMAAGARGAGAEDIQDENILWRGVQGAYYSEFENVALGVNARMDLGNSFSSGFLIDYVFQQDNRTTWVGSADLQWQHPLPGLKLDGWLGGGFGVVVDNLPGQNQKTQVEPFAVFFGGVGLAKRPVMPYVEMRFMTHETYHGVLYVGLRF
jgi:hypothetical protein